MDTKQKAKILKSFSLFQNLSLPNLESFSEELTNRVFPKNEILIQQGKLDDSVFFIYHGDVRVYRINEEGKEINIAILGKGEIIGEMAIISNSPRSAYVEAVEEVLALVTTGASFRNELIKEPEIALQLLNKLSQRILDSGQNLEDILSKSLKQRTLTLLTTLVKHSQKKTLNISQEELASILSATRPRVSEILQELQNEEKISLFHKKITIL